MSESLTILNRHFINGQWVEVDAAQANSIPLFNPATGQAFAKLISADNKLVDSAVIAARAAFDGWNEIGFEQRGEYVQKLVEQLQIRRDELVSAILKELGCPLWFSQEVQVDDPIDALSKHVGLARQLAEQFDAKLSQQDQRLDIQKEGIGVCVLITPWNYPLHQLIAKVAPAIVAGCTMVVKPSELTPLNALLLAEAIEAAGFPKGVFNCLFGAGHELGPLLTRHPEVDCISFTGSTLVGKQIQKDAADSIKRVCLELGGKSPYIIAQTNKLEQAISLGVEDVMVNSGQTCVALTRMLVSESVYADAVAIAKSHAQSLSMDAPEKDGVFMGPLVSKAQQQRVLHYIQLGLSEGATLVTGGGTGAHQHGYFVEPTIFADVHNDMRIAREEIFGPVLCIIPYKDEEDAIRIANDSVYGLGARVWSDDEAQCNRICRRIKAGLIFKNNAMWHNTAPFGGYKQSGNGRELGMYGIEEFLETKSIINE